MSAGGRRSFAYPAFVRRLGRSLYHARLVDFRDVSAMSTRLETLEIALQMELIEHLADALPPVPPASSITALSDLPTTVDGMWIVVDLAPVLQRYRAASGWASGHDSRTYRPQRGRHAFRPLPVVRPSHMGRDAPHG